MSKPSSDRVNKQKFTIQHYTYAPDRDRKGRFTRTVETVVGSLFSLDENHLYIALDNNTGEVVAIESKHLVAVK